MITPELAQAMIQRSLPRARLPGMRLAALAGGGVLMGLVLGAPELLGLPKAPGNVALLLAAFGFGIVILLARRAGRRQQRTSRLWTRANEAVLLEDWPAAKDRLCDLLSRPADNSAVRVQGLLGLAAVAEHAHQHQVSQVLYEHVLRGLSGQPLQMHAAAIGLAAAMLRNEETTGAVELIDKLARQDWPQPWKAHVELVRLFREVVMGQYDDVVASADARRLLFREHLSLRSGYGYGLLALGFHHRGGAETARRLWQDATLLISADKLVDRFPVLSELSRSYPAAEMPL